MCWKKFKIYLFHFIHSFYNPCKNYCYQAFNTDPYSNNYFNILQIEISNHLLHPNIKYSCESVIALKL